MGSIVVGYVAKPEGRAALRRAVEEARLRGLKLVVVSSQRGGRQPTTEDASDSDAELKAVHAELTDARVEHEIRQVIRVSDFADDLIAVAAEVDADFIVIGLRRRSPLGKLILGSSAQRVLLDAPCPVLAVKSGE
jgi:nucleotide-binding universal stress UspA family protein